LVACEIGELERAYQFFLQTATIDLTGKSKQYVGTLYIGGTHPAANGGAWIVAVNGFAGLRVTSEGFSLDPRLPGKWKHLGFCVNRQGSRFTVSIDRAEVRIEGFPGNSAEAIWRICGQSIRCGPGKTITHRIEQSPSIRGN